MMTYRWMVSEDGGATFPVVVKPAGVTNPLFEWVKDNAAERAGKRKRLATSLTFHQQEFQYLKNLRTTEGFCGAVYIRFEIKCGGSWEVLWTGRFPLGGGTWDYRKCTVVIKPETDDQLSCILQGQGVKHNILRVGPVTANVVVIPSLEFFICLWSFGAPICASFPTGFTPAHIWTPIPPYELVVMWREFAVTECVDGVPVEPPGTGWTLLTDDCAGSGTAKYVRTPEDAWSFGDPQFFLDGDGYPEAPPTTCGTWKEVGTYEYPVTPPGEVPFYVCLSEAEPVPLTRARTLESVLEFLLDKMGCDIEGIRSDFFGINPPGDAPGYVGGENYVTGGATQTEAICIVHKTDVIDPTATQPATKGDMSFKDLMAALTTMYKVLWTIDADGYLRIEHYKFWNNALILDLTAIARTDLVEYLLHETLNSEVPSVERLVFDEALGVDFIGADIVYSGPCVSEQGENSEIEYAVRDITTDVSMILADPTSVSRKGFVFLACAFNGTSYDVIIDEGAITGEFYSNAPMSVANLMRDYWTWDRYLPFANMNGEDVEFDGSRPTIQQPEITVKCFGCDALEFTGDGKVKSYLGEGPLGGVNGHLESANLDTDGNLRIRLRYSA